MDSYAWLPKSELSASQVASLKSELTIVPRTMVPDEDVEPLRLYQDTPDELGVPREFFYKHRRAAHEVIPAWTEGRKDLYSPMGAFTGILREEQEQAFQAVTTRLADTSQGLGGIVRAVPGWGKCLAPHTPVMLHNGSVVRADAVVTGDLLMGPDSKPRKVLSTTVGRGRLYRIVPEAGTPWVCNADHILTLVHAITGKIVDVPIEVYLALPSWQKRNLLQFSPEDGVDFPEQKKPLLVNPYFVGAWFGDGTKAFRGVAVSDFMTQEQRSQLGVAVSNIHRYKTASREHRREFLAGFLDAGGHTNSGAVRRDFAEAVAFVARSLGIRADIHSKAIDGVKHWRVNVLGDLSQLPLRLSWVSNALFDHKAVSLRQSFTVDDLPEGPYAGFTLAGDGRFLLGDFTVTHNTVAGLSLLAHYDVPSLILVHRGFLMDQWAERIKSFLPQAKVGRAQQTECSYEGASIVLGMVHSVVSGGYPQEFYDWPGLVMVDECLDEDTLVAVPDGFRRLGTLLEGDEVVTPFGTSKIKSKWVVEKEAFSYTTRSGANLVASEDHIVPVMGIREEGQEKKPKWTGKVEEVKIKDAPHLLRIKAYGDGLEFSIEEYLVGWFLGDGCCAASTGHKLVFAFRKNKKEMRCLFEWISKELAVFVVFRENARGDLVISFPADYSRAFMAKHKLPFGPKSRTAYVPEHLFESVSVGVIKGLFDAEGSTYEDRIAFDVCSIRLAKELQLMLSRHGVLANLRTYVQRNPLHGDRHRLTIFGDSASKYWRCFGFEVPKAGNPPKMWGIKTAWRSVFTADTIVNVDSVGVRSLVDIELEDPRGLFVANGFIVHNCHRMGAKTWGPAPGMFRARYRIGITATPRRKDGAENAFYYHLGPILFSAKEQRLRPKVRRVWTNFKLFKTDKFNPNLAPRSLILKFLLGSKVRNRTIALQIVEAVKVNRKCLVVSEQLKHLSALEEWFLKEWPLDQGFTPGIGYYVGGRTKEQLQEASKAQVIFATSQYSSEGLDIPSLDTLFLASPLSDVEQVVGRILRPSDGKKDPIVVDFRDDEVRQFKRQGEKRDAYYDRVTA